MKNIVKLFLNYLPDLLVLGGIIIFTYNLLDAFDQTKRGSFLINGSGHFRLDTVNLTVGVFLITLGVNIAIRRHFKLKKNNQSSAKEYKQQQEKIITPS